MVSWVCPSCLHAFQTYEGIYRHLDHILQQEQQGRLPANDKHKLNINIIKYQRDAHQMLAQRDLV